MKPRKKLNKMLSLKKSTISDLNKEFVRGGFTVIQLAPTYDKGDTCADTCRYLCSATCDPNRTTGPTGTPGEFCYYCWV